MAETEKQRYPLSWAVWMADALMERLKSVCDQITIAGSIRRGRDLVHDIDLVAVPIVYDRPGGLLGEMERVSRLDERLDEMGRADELRWIANGPKLKRFTAFDRRDTDWSPWDMPVDVYCVTAKQFALAWLIRTGSAGHNIVLAQRARDRGLQLDVENYRLIRECRDKRLARAVATPDERSIFAALGMPYCKPADREC